MSGQVVQLHNHSEYSILDGRSRIGELVGRVVELGQPAVALTDHGGMYGTIEFYRSAREAGIKPILGVEAYVAAGPLERKDPVLDRHQTHLTLLAMNVEGYQNLLKLTSLAHMKGMYYKPRIDLDALARHSDGLVILSGCMGGGVAQSFLHGDGSEGRRLVERYLSMVGADRFFIEVHDHGLDEQKRLNPLLFALAKEQGLGVVAACDSHYVLREDAKSHDVLLAIQTGSTLDDPSRFRIRPYGEYYVKSYEEMRKAFPEHALRNTVRIAEMCNVELDFSKVMLPEFEIAAGHTVMSKLREEVLAGLSKRGDMTDAWMERIEYELGIIGKAGYGRYFLIVQDYVRYARSQGIMAVPRGSVAGSLCMYALGICDIDPVKYDIMFERFLHEERKGMPDVDMDFADDRRDAVIAYVTQRYGADRVAHIGTFQTLGARAAIKDVARVLGVDYGETNRLTRGFPSKGDVTLASLRELDAVRDAIAVNPVMGEAWEIATELEGLVRGFGTHAAGILIAATALDEVVPIQMPPGKHTSLLTAVTQYDNNNRTAVIESIGLSKFDFLGLANLTSIRSACALIKHRHGMDLYGQSGEKLYSELPTEYANPLAARTYDMLAAGETTAVFQMESPGMRKALRLVKPTRLEDLPAVVALYRPGPMENIPVFAAAKADPGLVRKYHPDIDRFLAETYGVVTYQDQVLLLARTIAGFTWGEVDVLRKGMGKKLASVINEQKKKFLQGSVARGYEEDLAETLWETVAPFAGYGFNKAHAYCYGYVAYITAFLKANFPVEYMTAVLTLEAGNREKTAEAVMECKRLGITVLPPRINESLKSYAILADDQILYGLSALQNMGDAHLDKLLGRRDEHGGFASAEECLAGMNIRAATALVKSGALDVWGDRNALLDAMTTQAKTRKPGQMSMFGAEDFRNYVPMSDQDLMAYEKEAFGFYLTKNPLANEVFALRCTATSLQVGDMADEQVVIGGMVTKVKTHVQKNGKPMAFVDMEDMFGKLSCVFFGSIYARYASFLKPDSMVLIEGTVRMREEEPSIIATTLMMVG